jgi:hypothetical protein
MPTPSKAHHNDVAPFKIITYRPIKTTGTLTLSLTAGGPIGPLLLSLHIALKVLKARCSKKLSIPQAVN